MTNLKRLAVSLVLGENRELGHVLDQGMNDWQTKEFEYAENRSVQYFLNKKHSTNPESYGWVVTKHVTEYAPSFEDPSATEGRVDWNLSSVTRYGDRDSDFDYAMKQLQKDSEQFVTFAKDFLAA